MKKLEDYQLRVCSEKDDLDSKIDALEAFMGTPQYGKCSEMERLNLNLQFAFMAQYSYILGERIDGFTTTEVVCPPTTA